MAGQKLSLKRQRFAQAYAVKGNATDAAIDAGYAVKSRAVAGVVGHEVLKDPRVQEKVEDWRAYLEDSIMPSLRVVRELSRESEDPRVRLAASRDLLNRAGVGKQLERKTNIVNVFAKMDEATLMAKMAELAAPKNANVSDNTDDVSHNIHCATPNDAEKKDDGRAAPEWVPPSDSSSTKENSTPPT